ncbi:1-acyl-sn-glycerol-3-phosphate acyltransferase [Aliiroseovarius subalbicans]|uniref:1-acyl-sn-glycerol-3-phosphate acyltransferase n=1 Tax=Aliiroseovarius subalbicans TaxID=2925840 RepID=UPI001F57D98F|nr:1-acyl-sn-glycerol-3-phosphate acyltransferase [Aliiroseovarius subalbicans]MCI2400446.1 1-acyl-sn-glycerol-3-phosphate acyltransferase [Aliiroseovarius subalbicans]
MMRVVELPLWLLVLILAFATVTFASHFLFPSVRWFFRKRLQRAVARLNERLERPIEPFKLARRHDMIQRLSYDPGVAQAIVDHAAENGVPEQVAFEDAQRYAREIVPRFSAFAYFSFGIWLAKLLSRAFYRVRLGAFDAAKLGNVDKDATVVFVMNHRSNMDYVLVTWLAAERSHLSYAVGEWARVWPLRTLIRSMGAYFIRRRSRNALYRRVLSRYVQMATEGGVTQAMFPEGGLSLNGEVGAPKMGLMSYIIDGFEPGKNRDVVFIPVAMNYDRVLEDRVLVAADMGGHRKFKLRWKYIIRHVSTHLWQRITGRFHRFGYASVSFGTPVSLTDFLAGAARNERGDITAPLADEIMARIRKVVPVLPVPVVAAILLENEQQSREAVVERFKLLVEDMKAGGAHVHMPRDDLDYAVEVGLRLLLLRKLVIEEDGMFRVNPTDRPVLGFYANSIAHLCGAVPTRVIASLEAEA